MDPEQSQPSTNPVNPIVPPTQSPSLTSEPPLANKSKKPLIIISAIVVVLVFCSGSYFYFSRDSVEDKPKDEGVSQSSLFPVDNSCYRLAVSESELQEQGLVAVGLGNDNPFCRGQLVFVASRDSNAMVFEMISGDDTPEQGVQAYRTRLEKNNLDITSEQDLTIDGKPAKLLVHDDNKSVSGVGYTVFVATPSYSLGGEKSSLLMIYGDYNKVIQPLLQDILAKIEFK